MNSTRYGMQVLFAIQTLASHRYERSPVTSLCRALSSPTPPASGSAHFPLSALHSRPSARAFPEVPRLERSLRQASLSEPSRLDDAGVRRLIRVGPPLADDLR